MTGTAIPRGLRVQRVRAALKRHPLRSYLAGLWLRRHFSRASGAVVLAGGWRSRPALGIRGYAGTDGCTLSPGVRIEVAPRGRLEIGKGTFLNEGARIACELAVTVGRDCQIGWDAIITDSDQHARAGLGEATRPVVLGDRVWVGARAVILKGVTVGDGAVIAAGSVVTRDVPANTLVAGQPARVVRELPPTSGPAPLTVPQR